MKNSEFKYIDLRIDWSFKYVYGTRGNEDLLLNLLDAIMPEKHISLGTGHLIFVKTPH